MSPFVSAAVAASYLLSVIAYCWRRGTLRPDIARQLLREGAILLDVGTPEQYAAEHLAGALNIPVENLGARQNEVGEHARPVVLYARSSMRGAVAAQLLRGVGFHTVLSVGTLRGWRAEKPGGSWSTTPSSGP